MDRAKAYDELCVRLTNKNLIKHSLAVEAIMRGLAEHLKFDVEVWGLVGLLHDIDYEKTVDNSSLHGILGSQIVENLGFDPEIVYAVKAHNPESTVARRRKIDKALYSADPTSGLITAGALILPSRKLEDVTVEFIIKRMSEKSFAKGANRDQIARCDDLGLILEEFLEISINSMKKISDQLGL